MGCCQVELRIESSVDTELPASKQRSTAVLHAPSLSSCPPIDLACFSLSLSLSLSLLFLSIDSPSLSVSRELFPRLGCRTGPVPRVHSAPHHTAKKRKNERGGETEQHVQCTAGRPDDNVASVSLEMYCNWKPVDSQGSMSLVIRS